MTWVQKCQKNIHDVNIIKYISLNFSFYFLTFLTSPPRKFSDIFAPARIVENKCHIFDITDWKRVMDIWTGSETEITILPFVSDSDYEPDLDFELHFLQWFRMKQENSKSFFRHDFSELRENWIVLRVSPSCSELLWLAQFGRSSILAAQKSGYWKNQIDSRLSKLKN